MKNPTLAQLGGLSGSIADDLRKIQGRLDGNKVQQALNDFQHPFRQGVVKLALELFPLGIEVAERDGIFYATFTSTGLTGPEWEAHFDRRGVELSPNARKILNSSEFKPSKAGTIRPTGIIPGKPFSDANRLTKNIRAKAAELKLRKLDTETACLIRDGLSNTQINALGLNWIVGMHDPVIVDGVPRLLTAGARDVAPGLCTGCDSPGVSWDREDGFAFGASQVLKT